METLPADLKKISVAYVGKLKNLKIKYPGFYRKFSITNLRRQCLFVKMVRDEEKDGKGYDSRIAAILLTSQYCNMDYFEVAADVFNEMLYVNTARNQRLFEMAIRYSERFPNMTPVVENKIDNILKILRVPPKDLPSNYDYNYMRGYD